MKKTLLTLFLTWLSAYVFAYNSLDIRHPHTWGYETPIIESVEYHITPNGLFYEYEVTLEIGSTADRHVEDDSLEIQMHFELPENAIMHDSWLWIDDSVIVADLLDRWTATTIYEGIVQRKQDPSLLVKESATQYSLNVYPILAGQSRKLKMSFLLPALQRKNANYAVIPTSMFAFEYVDIFNPIDIYLNKNDENSAPSLNVESGETTISDDYVKYTIPSENISNEIYIANFGEQSGSDVFATIYKEQDEHFYQIQLPQSSDESQPTHHMFILDHSGSFVDNQQFISCLRSHIQMNLSESDSVTVFYAVQGVKTVSGTGKNILDLLKLDLVEYKDYGNAYSLLSEAVDVCNKSKLPVNLVMLSDVNEYWQEPDWSNTVNWLYETYDSVPPINTIYTYHYYDSYYYYYYDNRSNTYLQEIARRTGGNYWDISDKFDILDALYKIHNPSDIKSFSSHISFTDGFTFENFQQESYSGDFQQIGKFVGELPATVELNYIYNDSTYAQKEIVLTEENTQESDSLLRKYWAGCKIADLEKSASNDNDTKRNIIGVSLDNRVLSQQTAFLALDPKLNIKPEACEDCVYDEYNWNPMIDDIAWAVGSEEIERNELSSFTVYPQPIDASSALYGEVADGETVKSVTLYTIDGTKVNSYDVTTIHEGVVLNIDESGMYIIEIVTDKSAYTITVIK